jgi:hypothetical protein
MTIRRYPGTANIGSLQENLLVWVDNWSNGAARKVRDRYISVFCRNMGRLLPSVHCGCLDRDRSGVFRHSEARHAIVCGISRVQNRLFRYIIEIILLKLITVL